MAVILHLRNSVLISVHYGERSEWLEYESLKPLNFTEFKIMLDTEPVIFNKIYEAISEFVRAHGSTQNVIYLSEDDYGSLLREARSTVLGRMFSDAGLRFCDLEVKSHDSADIVIC